MDKLSGFIMKFSKKHSRKTQVFFYPDSTVFVFLFHVYFGEKMWQILHFSKFQAKSPIW